MELTENEMVVLQHLADAAVGFRDLAADYRLVDGDLQNFIGHIHDCQNAVLANAARRVFPEPSNLDASPSAKGE